MNTIDSKNNDIHIVLFQLKCSCYFNTDDDGDDDVVVDDDDVVVVDDDDDDDDVYTVLYMLVHYP